MRPRLSDNKKRNKPFNFRVSMEEKIRIKSHTRRGKYPSISDFIRTHLFNSSNKVISFDEETSNEIKRMEYEMNKVGVSLNQLAKRINIHDVYQFTSDDRAVFKQVLQELKNCCSVLQKYLEMIDQNR